MSEKELDLYQEYQQVACKHWLYRIIPRHRSQLYWYDFGHWMTWALFGNDDAGIFSEGHVPLYLPDKPVSFYKCLAWMLRNPLHNFCYYVIGTHGLPCDEFTLLKIHRKKIEWLTYKPVAKTVFAGRYTSFYLGFHGGKPLISLRLSYGHKWKSDFYIGWRETGSFGIKCLPLTKVSYVVWNNLGYEDE